MGIYNGMSPVRAGPPGSDSSTGGYFAQHISAEVHVTKLASMVRMVGLEWHYICFRWDLGLLYMALGMGSDHTSWGIG